MKKMLIQIVLFVGMLFLRLEGAMYQSSDLFELSESEKEVVVPSRLGPLKLYKNIEGFHILKDGRIYDVQNCFCSKILRGISNKQLAGFLGRNKPKVIIMTPEEFNKLDCTVIHEITGEEKDELLNQLFGVGGGYIVVHQMSDGEYELEAKLRLLGGWSWEQVGWCCLCVVGGAVVVAALCAGVGALAGVIYVNIASVTITTNVAAGVASAVTVTSAVAAKIGVVAGATIGFIPGGVGGGVIGVNTMPKETPEKHDEENPCTNNQCDLPEISKGGPGKTYKSADKSFFEKICPDFLKKKKGSEISEDERKKRLKS